jgi:hypothetical protein
MKSLFGLFILVFCLCLSVNAQDYKTSIGIRAGLPFGPSGGTVKHFFNRNNAFEGILSANNLGTGIMLTGLFQNEHWTGKYPSLNWYWGLGAHIGYLDKGASRWASSSFSGSVLGVDAVFGVEYTFDEIPLNISVDIMPSFNVFGYAGVNFLSSGISARYIF